MRFLHTADWQIGMRAAHVGGAGERVREERLTAARRVVSLAAERGAGFLVVAGDVFEDNAVDRVLVQRTGDILAEFPGPVYLLPGNHDPLLPGSVWEHPVWASRPNLNVLRSADPVDAPGARLLPCPLFEKHGQADPTRGIPARADGEGIRVGVAHGTIEGIRTELPEFPIARDAAARRGLDYLALGHWHSFGTIPDAAGAPRTAYSGTHETTKFGERDSGTCLLVTIGEPGAPPEVERLRSGGLAWAIEEREIGAEGELARLRAELDDRPAPETTLLDVRLSGLLFASEADEIDRIREIVASRFLFGRVTAGALRPAPSDDGWIADLPEGPVRAAAERLRSAAEGPAPEVASRALRLLFALARESRA
jgi:hypothetical protein